MLVSPIHEKRIVWTRVNVSTLFSWMLKNEILTLPRQFAGHHFGASGYQGSCKRARAGVHGSPVVQNLGQKQRFVLDSDADEAVDDERLMLESMSLTQIKARCFGKCYVARSPMLMQKMSDASTENRPHV